MKKFVLSSTVLASLTMMVGVASAAPAASPLLAAHTHVKIKNASTSTYQSGMTPSQMKTAYGISSLSNQGAGMTIAIIDAYGSPTIQNDLNTFDAQFGLPNTTITIAQPGGAPTTDGGWALETSLDVEWVHALAPQANIMLVEAKTSSIADLMTAEDYATNHGAVTVSNSWGAGEFSGETSYESHFNHAGIAYFASTGDNGAGVEWPSASPNVVAVGGTTLNIGSGGTYSSESAWSGSGGGSSAYFARPTYQNNWSNITSTRGVPDVSMDADPNSGAAVYDSTPDSGSTGWFQVGGTSLSAPMWASVVALADQSRSSKFSSNGVLTDIYNLAGTANSSGYTTNLHDITSGNNGGYNAITGYDRATGLGSPKANALVPNLISAP